MQGCPTQEFVFGNLKDPESAVSRISTGARAYPLLGELNTRPAITYLAGVSHARLAQADHGAHDDEHGEDNGAAGEHDSAAETSH